MKITITLAQPFINDTVWDLEGYLFNLRGAALRSAARWLGISFTSKTKVAVIRDGIRDHYQQEHILAARAGTTTFAVGDRLHFRPGTERAPFGTVIGEGTVTVTQVVDHGAATQYSPRFTYVVEALDGSGTQGTDARELSAPAR